MNGYSSSINGHNLSGLKRLKIDILTGVTFETIEEQVYLNSLNISGISGINNNINSLGVSTSVLDSRIGMLGVSVSTLGASSINTIIN